MKEKVFNDFKSTYKMSFWKKIILFFVPSFTTEDRGIDGNYTCEFKKFRGVYYLMKCYPTDG